MWTKEKTNEYHRKWYQKHPDYMREYMREYVRRQFPQIKREVLTYYGGGKCACIQCGFSDIRALTLDHINGDGASERRQKKGKSGVLFYLELRTHKFPEGYQTLCMNCQFLKEYKNNGGGLKDNGKRGKGRAGCC